MSMRERRREDGLYRRQSEVPTRDGTTRDAISSAREESLGHHALRDRVSLVEMRRKSKKVRSLPWRQLLFSFMGIGIGNVVIFIGVFACTYFGIAILQSFLVPPRIQTFPLALSYSPFTLYNHSASRSYTHGEIASPLTHALDQGARMYVLRDAPESLWTTLQWTPLPANPLPSTLSFDVDAPAFLSWDEHAPHTAIGFIDMETNITGLVAPDRQSNEGMLGGAVTQLLEAAMAGPKFIMRSTGLYPPSPRQPLKGRRYPMEVALLFSYNTRGMHKEDKWLMAENQPVEVRFTLYSDKGEKVLGMSSAFFPENREVLAQEIARGVLSAMTEIMLWLVPISVRQIFTTTDVWRRAKVVLLPSFSLSGVQESARLIKVSVTPPLPMQAVNLSFQGSAEGFFAWLQIYPRVMPLILAVIFAVFTSTAFTFLALSLVAIYVSQ